MQLDPNVQRAVDELAISCEVLACNPEWADTELFCANYNIPRDHAANAILIAAKTEPKKYAVCLVLATTKIDVNHKLSKLMGIKRLSFAQAEETKAVTGQAIGGVTVFGLPPEIPLYIDNSVMTKDYAIVGGGNRSSKIRIAPSELLKIPSASVADIAVPR